MFVKIVFISPLDAEPLQGKQKRISALINIDTISSIAMLEDRFDSWWVFMANASYELPKSENELFMMYVSELVYIPDIEPVCETVHYPELKVQSVTESVIKKGS